MKILILNWRDIKNPASGGAEILTHEMAKRWAEKKHHVTHFSASYKNAKPQEIIDSVRFVRKGRWWNVHVFAFFYYFKNRNKTDVIIDEVHWFPFFSALYARKKTVALTCEVANKLLFTLFPYPIAVIFRGIEKIYLRLYRNVPTMAISESTKNDLVNQGVMGNLITVIPMGINRIAIKNTKKEADPTIIFVARLNKQKGIEDAIHAISRLTDKIKNIKLWVVGAGDKEYIKHLRELAETYGVSGNIIYWGYVTDAKKFELMARSQVIIVPSVQEGFGLTIPEAGSVGTPAVAYDVQGMRDIINNNINGLLIKATPDALARGIEKILTDKNYLTLCKKALEMSKIYNWDDTAKTALDVLKNVKQ